MTSLSAQVMTVAHDPQTGEQATFPTPADVPESWVKGPAPDSVGNTQNETLVTLARVGTSLLLAYFIWELMQ